jgi:hypothetical protein
LKITKFNLHNVFVSQQLTAIPLGWFKMYFNQISLVKIGFEPGSGRKGPDTTGTRSTVLLVEQSL